MAYDIDYKKVRKLASIRCTHEEIASVLEIPYNAFKRLLEDDPLLKEEIEIGHSYSRASLRRLQWRHANGFGPAAVAMTIHLAKHWLGETDRSTIEIDGNININQGVSDTSDRILQGIDHALLEKQERIELMDLCDRIDEIGLVKLSEPQRIRFFALMSKAGGEENFAERKPAPILALPAPSLDNRESA